MRYLKLMLPQVILAALCGGLALFYFGVGFAFGDAGREPPVEWKIVFDAIIGMIVLLGFGLGSSPLSHTTKVKSYFSAGRIRAAGSVLAGERPKSLCHR